MFGQHGITLVEFRRDAFSSPQSLDASSYPNAVLEMSKTNDDYLIRTAESADLDAILKLMPRLAEGIPEGNPRTEQQIIGGDVELLKKWAKGDGEGLVFVAVDSASDGVAGFGFARMREELLSHEPSVHLEALVVRSDAGGNGLGGLLIDAIEQEAKEKGAKSMSLHVFSRNAEARGLYRRKGFEEELIRCIKHLF